MSTKQDKQDERERKKIDKQVLKILAPVLRNSDGFKRLHSLSNDEWQEAQRRDGITNAT
jgi:hypothetical protein